MNESNLVQKFIWFSERAILLTIALATLFASASEIIRIISVKEVNLSDLFLLFIYAEVLGMVASFYANNRIPVTLPLIIAMTALTRMIIQESKDLNAINIIYEATGILILAISAYIMTLKDKISLKKLLLREKIDESDIPDMTALMNIKDLYFGGDMEAAPALSGQSSGLIDEIKPVKQIIDEIVKEFNSICDSMSELKI